MHYALYCIDKENALDLRKATREKHLEYIEKTKAAGQFVYGKPMLTEDGDMMGSLVIINVENREAADHWAENDPYAQADLFASVTITRVAE